METRDSDIPKNHKEAVKRITKELNLNEKRVKATIRNFFSLQGLKVYLRAQKMITIPKFGKLTVTARGARLRYNREEIGLRRRNDAILKYMHKRLGKYIAKDT